MNPRVPDLLLPPQGICTFQSLVASPHERHTVLFVSDPHS